MACAPLCRYRTWAGGARVNNYLNNYPIVKATNSVEEDEPIELQVQVSRVPISTNWPFPVYLGNLRRLNWRESLVAEYYSGGRLPSARRSATSLVTRMTGDKTQPRLDLHLGE